MTTTISELEEVRKAANLYYEGLHNGDIELLKKAFHPQAMMYGCFGADPMITEIKGLFDYVAAHPSPAKSGEAHKCSITKIDCVGNAASVEMLQESFLGMSYINYFQLLKINGNWTIVSKSFDMLDKKMSTQESFTSENGSTDALIK